MNDLNSETESNETKFNDLNFCWFRRKKSKLQFEQIWLIWTLKQRAMKQSALIRIFAASEGRIPNINLKQRSMILILKQRVMKQSVMILIWTA